MLSVSLSLLFSETVVISNGNLSLSLDVEKDKLEFVIDGNKWPLVAKEAKIGSSRLRGASRVRAQSFFSLSVITPSLNKVVTLNTDVADITEWSVFADGVDVGYMFDEGIGFKASFRLNDHGLKVSVDTSSFVESEDCYIASIQFLPFFGANNIKEDGYFAIPDGCGALMHFNNGKKGQYKEPVYGQDKSSIKQTSVTNKEDVLLPFIGIENEKKGTLIITAIESASRAKIIASTSNENNPYNIAFFEFELRTSLEQRIASDASQILYESPRQFNGEMSILITPCPGGYSSMASTFSDIFISERDSGNRAFVMNVIVAKVESRKILGIPIAVDKFTRVTSFENIANFISALRYSNKLILNFESWNTKGLKGEAPTAFDFVSSIGSEKDRKKLFSALKAEDIVISAAINPIKTRKRSSGVIKNLASEPASQYEYYVASSSAKPDTRSYLKRLDKISLLEDNKSGIVSSYEGLGEVIYSHFGDKNPFDRAEYTNFVSNLLSNADPYFVCQGSFYALQNAHFVLSSPDQSSRHNLFDEDVPLLQIALSGKIGFSSSNVNKSPDPIFNVLFSLETGGALSFEFTDKTDSKFLDTIFERYGDDISSIAGKKIINHEIIDSHKRRTLFENGVEVIVDYSTGTYEIKGEIL